MATSLISNTIPLDDTSFHSISNLVYSRFGINLTDKKRALVHGRLHSLIRSLDLSSFDEYCKYIKGDTKGDRLLQLIDRISTNHTFFFRETDHFEYLANRVLPNLLNAGTGRDLIRIWCAGCATGEEPYTLAMVLAEALGDVRELERIRILATDISMSALQIAKRGLYDKQKSRTIPARYRQYVKQEDNNDIGIRSELRRAVLFKRLNLIGTNSPFKHKFDVVFCRNVMIYFANETRNDVVRRFGESMKSGARIFIGHSETLGRDSEMFRYIKPTVYARI